MPLCWACNAVLVIGMIETVVCAVENVQMVLKSQREIVATGVGMRRELLIGPVL